MWPELDATIVGFACGTTCSLLDLVIDTSGAGVSAKPHLAMWAFRAHDEASFDETLHRARERAELVEVFDVVDEVASDTSGFPLGLLFPSWPEELGAGVSALASHLVDLVAAHPEEFEGVTRIWLRVMDAGDVRTIR